jgi:hypothetical protein
MQLFTYIMLSFSKIIGTTDQQIFHICQNGYSAILSGLVYYFVLEAIFYVG